MCATRLNLSSAMLDTQVIKIIVLLMGEHGPLVSFVQQYTAVLIILGKAITQALRNAQWQADFDFEAAFLHQR